MEIYEILSRTDHSLLKPEATWKQIQTTIDEAIAYQTATACVSPCYVKQAVEYAAGRTKIGATVGFPNGCNTTEVKVFETKQVVEQGGDEVDMVANIGLIKDKCWDQVLAEIKAVRAACPGKLLKVIIETCLLTEEEKIQMCRIVSESGADYIKTSTGFSKGGATREDIVLFKKYVAPHVKIKAAGGIRTLQDAEDFIRLGADRIGASALVKEAKTVLHK